MHSVAMILRLTFVLSPALATFSAVGLVYSTQSGDNPAAAQQPTTRLRELLTLIELEISAPIADEPKQCKLIAFGSKPCGGPRMYLVYSTATANEVKLKQLVKEYNELEWKLNQQQKIMSECEYVREPNLDFVGGVCAIKDK
jgi:hypothetical protein